MGSDGLHPCPACGFEVLSEPAGSYDICPVCDWEDDEIQLRFPAMRGGANTASLFEWQRAVLLRLPPQVVDHEGYHRCPDWRPLTVEECGDTTGMPTTGRAYFEELGAEEPAYYWRKGHGGQS
jgi:hypothetical protein